MLGNFACLTRLSKVSGLVFIANFNAARAPASPPIRKPRRASASFILTDLRRKRRRKRYGSYDRRGRLTGCHSITERPAIVEEKRRVGDWEADPIIGQHHQQAIVSVAERKSKLCFLKKVERNTSDAVEQALSALLKPVIAKCHTITSDNGREFANHQEIAVKLQAGFYFAHPYSSWERGLNENTNGLVRQYFLKKSDFSKITDSDVQRVMDRLNNRPRKTLGYKTPNQVCFKQKRIALTS